MSKKQGVAEGSKKAHGWKIGKMYRGSNEPFEVVYVDATDENTALAKAHHSLKPNHMQILTVLRKPQGVAEGSATHTFSDFHDWKEAVYAMNADITQMGRAGQYTAIGSNGVVGEFNSTTNKGFING